MKYSSNSRRAFFQQFTRACLALAGGVGLSSFIGRKELAELASAGSHSGPSPGKQIRLACVGDSITYGARLESPEKDSYPAQLQNLLGEGYLVKNFGVSSCTLLRKGIPSVWEQLDLIQAFQPDRIVISLGTNDTCGMGTCGGRKCWEYRDEFQGDYIDLINHLRQGPAKPAIWICAPTPMVLETPELSEERIQGLQMRIPRLRELIGIIQRVSEREKTGFIDLNTPMQHHPEWFTKTDGVHPNKTGYRILATLVAKAMK